MILGIVLNVGTTLPSPMTEIVLVSINRLIMVVERDVVSARRFSAAAASILVALSSGILKIAKSFRGG